MKTLLVSTIVAFLASIFLMTANAGEGDGKLRHVVSFKFKPTVSKDKIKEIEDAFRALKGKVSEIQSYEWGTNNSPEKHDKGFTHCFILSFKSEKDRDAYLVHPEHKKFGGLLNGLLDDVFVVDFWAKD